MFTKKIMLFFVGCTFLLPTLAQNEKCATMSAWDHTVANDADALNRMAELERFTESWTSQHRNDKSASITIPVVVHVLYNTAAQNISDAQIMSQIDILNEDFRLMNSDSLTPSNPFWFDAADTEIEFCMAQRDPNGNPTTGITRTYTDTVYYDENNIWDMKDASVGGVDNWNPNKYLNLWVVDMTGTTLGFATFPSDLSTDPDLDGVVIRHEAFGNTGTAVGGFWGDNDLGRTATHEVGHWLNLRHIWGDAQCGDDFVSDTPEHEMENSGCPTFPHNTFNLCGLGADGEMFMNYMDYPDDACLVMFTYGQKDRMHAALNGARSSLLTSNGCSPATGIEANASINKLEVYPNPTSGLVNIDFKDHLVSRIQLHNVNGKKMYDKRVSSERMSIDHADYKKGLYFMSFIYQDGSVSVEKLMIQ